MLVCTYLLGVLDSRFIYTYSRCVQNKPINAVNATRVLIVGPPAATHFEFTLKAIPLDIFYLYIRNKVRSGIFNVILCTSHSRPKVFVIVKGRFHRKCIAIIKRCCPDSRNIAIFLLRGPTRGALLRKWRALSPFAERGRLISNFCLNFSNCWVCLSVYRICSRTWNKWTVVYPNEMANGNCATI